MVKPRKSRASILDELMPVQDEGMGQEMAVDGVNDTVDTGEMQKKQKNPVTQEPLVYTIILGVKCQLTLV